MAKLTRQERVDIARTRLLRVLGSHQIAHMRTLEMKISDAGPFDQRIDPHILTEARNELILEGQIVRYRSGYNRPPWYYLGNTDFATLQPRLAELETVLLQQHAPLQSFRERLHRYDLGDLQQQRLIAPIQLPVVHSPPVRRNPLPVAHVGERDVF